MEGECRVRIESMEDRVLTYTTVAISLVVANIWVNECLSCLAVAMWRIAVVISAKLCLTTSSRTCEAVTGTAHRP